MAAAHELERGAVVLGIVTFAATSMAAQTRFQSHPEASSVESSR